MRILIHGINFSPELTGIGKYSGEMAEWLAGRGHEVRVVTAPPYYPQWRVAEGYANWWNRDKDRGLRTEGKGLRTEQGGSLVVYTIRFERAIYVLHCFQKKSPSGIRTAGTDVELIHERLKLAKVDYEVRYGKKS